MLCRKPYINSAGMAFGCGQCLPCRINRRNVWQHRIMLESTQYEDNAFVTLTYNDEKLKEQCPDGSLNKRDPQLFMKKLRKKMHPLKIRYYCTGEYGEETYRPHFHLALFNYPSCQHGMSTYSDKKPNCCINCDRVRDAWGNGHVFLGTLEDNSATYIAKYISNAIPEEKKGFLATHVREYSTMSTNPGIGYDALWDIASQLITYGLHNTLPDVPIALRHGKKIFPLGNYLIRSLREMIGRVKNAPQEVIDEMEKNLLPMRLLARNAPGFTSYREILLEEEKGKYIRLSELEKRNKKKGLL